jgi:hypothetical protein
LDERKQAKLQWVQYPSERNVDNLNMVRREASRHFRNKKGAYFKAKIGDLETNSIIKNIRDFYKGISDFKKGYQPRTTIGKKRQLTWSQTPTVSWVCGENISPSC